MASSISEKVGVVNLKDGKLRHSFLNAVACRYFIFVNKPVITSASSYILYSTSVYFVQYML